MFTHFAVNWKWSKINRKVTAKFNAFFSETNFVVNSFDVRAVNFEMTNHLLDYQEQLFYKSHPKSKIVSFVS